MVSFERLETMYNIKFYVTHYPYHMEFVYVWYLKIFGLEKCLRYVRSVGPVHEDFVVPVRISIYLSSNHYIAILALSVQEMDKSD